MPFTYQTPIDEAVLAALVVILTALSCVILAYHLFIWIVDVRGFANSEKYQAYLSELEAHD